MGPHADDRSVSEFVRDGLAGVLAWLPAQIQGLLFGPFRRPTLWWLFKAYGTELALVPAGPRGNRFRMWANPAADTAFIVGIYEPGCVRTLRRYVKAGSFCVDVGANLGYFSIFMSRLVGGRGRVVAFEPMPDTVETLRENVRLNGLQNVSVIAAAAADRSGSVELFTGQSEQLAKTASMVAYRLEGAARTTVVDSLRLDDYFAEEVLLPDLIKIDVEGAEAAVLNGARKTLARGKPVLVIEIHAWGSPASQRVLHLLSEIGYSASIFETRTSEALCLATPLQ